MFAVVKKIFEKSIAWIVVLLCIVLIGYVLYPNFSEKYQSLCYSTDTESPCNQNKKYSSDKTPRADQIQRSIEDNVLWFFWLIQEAIRTIFTDESGKKPVQYIRDDSEQKFVVGEK